MKTNKRSSSPEKPVISRRRVLGTAGWGAGMVGLSRAPRTNAAELPKLSYFSAAEFALVDALAEIMIPTDEHSPGARAAGVAIEIDQHLSDLIPAYPDHAKRRESWRTGIKAINTLATETHGKPLVSCSPEQQLALVTSIAANEGSPKRDVERFFGELKREVVRAYYSSEIGVLKEIGYLGNTAQVEYAGIDGRSVPRKNRLKRKKNI